MDILILFLLLMREPVQVCQPQTPCANKVLNEFAPPERNNLISLTTNRKD